MQRLHGSRVGRRQSVAAAHHLVEAEYLHAMTKAEPDWLCSMSDELRSGTLSWSHEELAEVAKQFLG